MNTKLFLNNFSTFNLKKIIRFNGISKLVQFEYL